MMRSLILACACAGMALAATPTLAQDADMVVRVNRLEGQVRQLSGQIEQLQFQNRKLEDTLRKFQQDVEFRFQELKPARPVAAAPAAARAVAAKPPVHPVVPAPSAAPATTGAVKPRSVAVP